MDEVVHSTAEETLRALVLRLRRIEFLLCGSCEDPVGELYAVRKAGRENAVKSRLNSLERDLARLTGKSRTVKDILDLHTNFPEVFRTTHPSNVTPQSILTVPEKTTTVLSAASEYHAASSQLTSIMDSPVPEPAASADLVLLLPRLRRVEVLQEAQARKIALLRKRSAAISEQWFLVGIQGVNECFAEWDERTFTLDKNISRRLRDMETT